MLTIREARASDDQQLGELLVDSFVEAYARKMPDVVVNDERKRDLRDLAAKRGSSQAKVLVAEMNGESVGTLTILMPAAASRSWTPNTAEIRFMAVSHDCRGQ